MTANSANAMKVELVGDTDILVRRHFNAAQALVWRAHTEPELVKRWMLGPDGWSMPVCEMDLRPGGAYKYRWRNEEDGSEFGFFGTIDAVEPPTRIVQTEHPDWEPSAPPTQNTMTLRPDGEGTLLTLVISCISGEMRQTILDTGMVDGMEQTYDRLESLLPDFG